MATISIEEIKDGSIYNKNLQPTPPDIWDLAMRLSEYFDLKELSPYKFFDKTERIHLDKANLIRFSLNNSFNDLAFLFIIFEVYLLNTPAIKLELKK